MSTPNELEATELEAPEPDGWEQRQEVPSDESDAPPESVSGEANPADVAEQRRAVPFDEDEVR